MLITVQMVTMQATPVDASAPAPQHGDDGDDGDHAHRLRAPVGPVSAAATSPPTPPPSAYAQLSSSQPQREVLLLPFGASLLHEAQELCSQHGWALDARLHALALGLAHAPAAPQKQQQPEQQQQQQPAGAASEWINHHLGEQVHPAGGRAVNGSAVKAGSYMEMDAGPSL